MMADLVVIIWLCASSMVTFVGLWLHFCPQSVPTSLTGTFIYGKVGTYHKSFQLAKLIQVPKRWFLHFYIYAAVINLIFLVILCRLYFFNIPTPNFIYDILDILAPSRSVRVDSLSAFLAMLFVFVHTSRRVLECIYVSVYSDSPMNVIHYLAGFAFYTGVTLTLLSECPGFSYKRLTYQSQMTVSWYHIVGTLLYIWSTYQHSKSHIILANLRKNDQGEVISIRHVIPKGGLFEYVSCPHYFAEIMLYLSLAVVLGLTHVTWWFVISWVLGCQIVSALLTHDWYRQKFDDYPKQRKAVIPFFL